jgi:hypothetical protein
MRPDARTFQLFNPPQWTMESLPFEKMIAANTGAGIPRPPGDLWGTQGASAGDPNAFGVIWHTVYTEFPDCTSTVRVTRNSVVLNRQRRLECSGQGAASASGRGCRSGWRRKRSLGLASETAPGTRTWSPPHWSSTRWLIGTQERDCSRTSDLLKPCWPRP